MKVNIASWNIWIYGKRDYKGIAQLIEKNSIEIVGIQEAAIYYDAKRTEDIVKEIAGELGFEYEFFKSTDPTPTRRLAQGNAVISKFPISEARSYDINPTWIKKNNGPERERRILVASKINLGDVGLNFLTTHLQFSVKFAPTNIRLAQVEKVISIIERLRGNIVLTGDFNSVPENNEMRLLGRHLSNIGSDKPTWTIHPFRYHSWHEKRLKYRLDNILISKNLKGEGFRVLKSRISDHLPIMATISV